jgi:hypothetical protein
MVLDADGRGLDREWGNLGRVVHEQPSQLDETNRAHIVSQVRAGREGEIERLAGAGSLGVARVVLQQKRGQPPTRSVADGAWSPTSNSHAYKIAFYSHALDCPGVPIYPRVDRDVATDFEVRGPLISFLTVDLAATGLSGLDALAGELDRRLAVPST